MAQKINYVSLGDSIAAGHTIDANWDVNYGERSQFSYHDRTATTTLVPGCYTYLIGEELKSIYGAENVTVTSFARSGDTVQNLIDKLDSSKYGPIMQSALAEANLVTICIGANDILQPAMLQLGQYVSTGDLTELTNIVNNNLSILSNDSHTYSYVSLFNKLYSINPTAKYIFTTIYNPYKYLYIDPNRDGFFEPLLNLIPSIPYTVDLGFTTITIDLKPFVQEAILNTGALQTVFNRVNSLPNWVNTRVDDLDNVLKNRISSYNGTHPNFIVTDSKMLFDKIPDRNDNSSQVHYNDLVSVEYTRNYNTVDMNWGALWNHGNAFDYWWNLITKHLYWKPAFPSPDVWDYVSFDTNSFATELGTNIVERVIMPDVDPHPEYEGHKLLKRAFNDVYGLIAYDSNTHPDIGDIALANRNFVSTISDFNQNEWYYDASYIAPFKADYPYTNYKNSYSLDDLVQGSSIRNVPSKFTTLYFQEERSRSLRVWMPLINDLCNQGLSDIKPTSSAANPLFIEGKTAQTALNTESTWLNIPWNYTEKNQISFAFWIRPNSPAAWADIISLGANANRIEKTTTNQYTWYSNATSLIPSGTNLFTLNNNTWNHIAMVADGSQVRFFLNGDLVLTKPQAAALKTVFGEGNYILISARTTGGTNRYAGAMNDLRIYDYALSIKEIKEISKGLVAHWKMSGENPNLAFNSYGDRSGAGYLVSSYDFDRAGFGRYLAAGEKCSLTVCYTPHSNFHYWNPHLNNGNIGGWMPNIYSDGTTNRQIGTAVSRDGWTYYNNSNPENGNSDYATIRMYCRTKNEQGNNAQVTIHWIKLQIGDSPATYWSPSISEDPGYYSIIEDCSGYGYDGISNQIVAYKEDSPRYVHSGYFNGATKITTKVNTKGWTDFTMAAWVNPSRRDADRNCIMIGNIYLTIDASGKIATYAYGKSKEGYHTSSTTVPLNQWTHIAATWNNTTGVHKIYMNGAPVLTVTDCTGAVSNDSQNIEIGMEKDGWRTFAGKLSDLRLYVSALSDKDIADLYHTPISITQTGTLIASELIENNQVSQNLIQFATNNYWISKEGTLSGVDNNWISTNKIPVTPSSNIHYRLNSHTLVGSILVYNTEGRIIGSVVGSKDNEMIEGIFKIPSGAAYVTITGGSQQLLGNPATIQYAYIADAKFHKNGVVEAANFSSNAAKLSNMKTRSLPDGTTWARIFHHDLKTATAYWDNIMMKHFDAPGRFSRMDTVDDFKNSDNTYEFMLTYPQTKRYCPAGYTQLECIESTGTQWINTGVVGPARWEFDIQFKLLDPASQHRQLMGYGAGGTEYWGLHFNGTYENGGTVFNVGGGRRDTIVDDMSTNATARVNSVWVRNKSQVTTYADDISSKQYQLFAIASTTTYSCYAKLYRCKCWKERVLTRDFIPVRREYDGKVGLFDLVENKFYTNAGSGEFLAYSFDAYIPLDYIEGRGAHIDTGVLPTQNTGIDIICMPYHKGNDQFYAFGGAGGVHNDRAFECYAWDNTYQFNYGSSAVHLGEVSTQTKTRLIQKKANIRVDKNNLTTNTYTQNASIFTSPKNITLLALNRTTGLYTNNYQVRLFGCRIFENDIVIRDFIPVYSTLNGQAGLYDKIHNKFYPSSNPNQAFWPGREINKPIDTYDFLDYIEATGTQYIDTNYANAEGFKFEIGWQYTTVSGSYIVGSHNEGSPYGRNGVGAVSNIHWELGTGDTCPGSSDTITAGIKYALEGSTVKGNSYLRVNNKTVITTSDSSARSGYNQYLFYNQYSKYHGHPGLSGRMYYCNIYDKNNILKRSFKPVRRNSDGAVGMLDLLTNTFYPNVGSGAFYAGPRTIQPQAIEYYNRWIQTSSPNHEGTPTGFKAIAMSWQEQFKNGILKMPDNHICTIYCCDTYNGNWFAPLGQKATHNWGSHTIPAANGSSQLETELWVRTDRQPVKGNISIQKPNTIVCSDYLEN